MAHLRSYERTCDEYACHSRATQSLYSYRNDHMGDYCRKHARERLARLNKAEKTEAGGTQRRCPKSAMCARCGVYRTEAEMAATVCKECQAKGDGKRDGE